MTEQEIRRVRERWDLAYDRLMNVRLAQSCMEDVEKSLSAECERLAEIIAEHDHAPIMTVVEPQEGGAT